MRNSALTRLLWGFMGLYLLNLSVDPVDYNPEHIPEDLSLNDQESIIELVFEQLLGYENAIKEYDDLDAEEHNKKKEIRADWLGHLANVAENTAQWNLARKKAHISYEASLRAGFAEVQAPPPKA